MSDPRQPGDGLETVVATGTPSPADRTAVERLRPGLVIAERFRLESPIGEGGMGVVWRATHLTLQAPVAIKLLFPSQIDPAQAEARFLREARASAALRSAHIIQVFDYGVHGGLPYLVMEMLEGRTLGDRIAEGPLSFAETLELMRDLCAAIGRAHAHDVVHRDLKPANIFLVAGEVGGRERAKILDFGIAKFLAKTGPALAETQTGAILGTPYYMSPEQLTQSKSVDHRADLWSLGVIVFQCLTGTRPFESPSLAQLCVAITTQDPPPVSQLAALPRGVDRWMAKALARDVDARFDSAEQMLTALEALSENPIDRSKPSGAREVEFELGDDLGPGLELDRGAGVSMSASRGAPSPSLGGGPAYVSPSSRPARSRLPSILIGGGLIGLAVAAYFMWPWAGTSRDDQVAVAGAGDDELDIAPAPDDPPPVERAPATGLGDPCEAAADCGWDDPCAPTRCVAADASTKPARSCEGEAEVEPPGTCACVDSRCVLHPSEPPPPKLACAAGQCGLDEASASCKSGEMEEANEKRVVGPVCVCNADDRCAFTWVEPIRCKSTRDCWVSEGPPFRPIARPKAQRKREFLPCKDGELAPVCRERECSLISYGCD